VWKMCTKFGRRDNETRTLCIDVVLYQFGSGTVQVGENRSHSEERRLS
jgi:hypothetical protein